MQIGLVGISYKTAGLDLREKVTKAVARLKRKELDFFHKIALVTLSTCNRTELYFSSDNLAEVHGALVDLLRVELGSDFDSHLYSFFKQECFSHLSLVTSGVDSALLGEAEIQRQVKDAYNVAMCEKDLSKSIHFLFQKGLKIGKMIRSHYSLRRGLLSLEEAMFNLSRWVCGDEKINLLFVGNSQINRQVIDLFWKKGVRDITLSTRALHAATDLQKQYGVNLLPFNDLHLWKNYSLVVCGTNTSSYLIKRSSDIRTRLIFDLSVPRCVDPWLAFDPKLSLYNIEQLEKVVNRSKEKKLEEKNHIESVVRLAAKKQYELFHHREMRLCSGAY